MAFSRDPKGSAGAALPFGSRLNDVFFVDNRSSTMGYNRSGRRRTERLKRAKRERARLALKAQAEAAAPPSEEASRGILAKVKDAAQGVVEAVGSALHTAAEKITGKGE